jgi:PilZ domain
MTLKTERRTDLRKRPLSLVYVELPPSNGGMMRDLSEHGFSLRAMIPLQQSEKVPFSFVLDTSARIDGEAIVLRLDEGGHVAALEFAGLPLHSRDQIRRWLERFDEPLTPQASPAQPMPSEHASLTELRAQIRAPRPPSSAPPAVESAPPLPENAIAPTEPQTPPMPISPAAENVPPPPPLQTVMALPKISSPPPQAAPPARPSAFHRTLEQVATPALPPLLKLSSVRPGPPPTEIPAEPVAQVAIPKPVAEPPARVQLSLPKPEPPVATEPRIPEPLPAPSVAPRRGLPPALEPLSPLEGETDSAAPGWMDRFTLGLAIRIMLFLTLLAGSYVYHRELGQALIWLGHEIAGEDPPEISKVARPEIPPASHATPESTPSASAVESPPQSVQQPPDTGEPKSAILPGASDQTPSPQLKDATPGSLVPLTQVTRPPPPAPPTDQSVEAGQQEYLKALQILRSPGKASEVPAAIQLLWVAVKKGNSGAEIELAELFRTGRGVAKNCDQTRILLSAAARRGSPEARNRLDAFRREGCSN